jgi:hypothetical protein
MNEAGPREQAVRTTLAAAALNILGTPIELLFARELPIPMPLWPVFAAMAVGVAVVVTLLVHGRQMSMSNIALLYVVNNTAIALALLLLQPYFALLGRAWSPFQEQKLGVLVASLLAPTLGSGIVAIATLVASALALFAELAPDDLRELPVAEPGPLLIFAIFAVVILFYRMHLLEVQRSTTRIATANAAAAATAQTALAIRDLANTPLQTLRLSVSRLRRDDAGQGIVLDRMDHAITRISELNEMLRPHGEEVLYAGPASFDAPSRLRRAR